MPQLIPFYFVNEYVAPVIGLAILVILCSTYFLPATMSTQLIRKFFTIM